MLDSVERKPAPRRLALGSNAYESVRAAPAQRLEELDVQKALACSADSDA